MFILNEAVNGALVYLLLHRPYYVLQKKGVLLFCQHAQSEKTKFVFN